jgi:hypothetical protein
VTKAKSKSADHRITADVLSSCIRVGKLTKL